MEKWKKIAAHIGAYPAALAKWLAVGALIGGIGGVIGSLFHIGVNYATQMRAAHPWILYLLPVLGLIIVGLYRVTKVEGKDTNAVIESVHFGKNVPVLLVPVIFISTVLTHLGGGSAGREGAALQIGGGIGFEAGRLLRLGEKDLPLATLCGMSAVFSALFGTPLTAAIFAMEVISVGVFYYAGLIPCLTAALVGYLVSLLMGVPPTRFAVADPGLDPWTMLLVILLAIGCAVVSILFCRGLQKTGKLAARLLPNPYGRVLVGGALVIVLTLLVGNTNYNGAGMEMVEQAVAIITEDNSRYEDVNDIMNDIEVGIKKTNGKYIKIPDRREAIKYAIDNAKEGDIILILGKGHETYQEKNGERTHFDDREEVLKLFK